MIGGCWRRCGSPAAWRSTAGSSSRSKRTERLSSVEVSPVARGRGSTGWARTGAAGGSMDDFAGRLAPLEYWFLKVVSGDLAFLVDWIVRKDAGEAEVRVSLWVRGHGRVVRDTAQTWRVRGSTVEIADACF